MSEVMMQSAPVAEQPAQEQQPAAQPEATQAPTEAVETEKNFYHARGA